MYKAVIFDVGHTHLALGYVHKFRHVHIVLLQIGGVVMRSPFIAIAAYEQKLGIPSNYLNCSMYVHFK